MKKLKIIAAILIVVLAYSTVLIPVQPVKASKNTYITRAQAVAAINRKLGIGSYSVKKMARVTDCKPKDKSYKIMAKAVSAGLISPNAKGRLYPNKKADYKYVASILAKIWCVKADAIPLYRAESRMSTEYDYVSSGRYENDLMQRTIDKKTKLTNKMLQIFLKKNFTYTVTRTKKNISGGNVLINRPGVALKDCALVDGIVIADGAGNKSTTLKTLQSNGDTIVRGGKKLVVKEAFLGNIVITKNVKNFVLKIFKPSHVNTIKVNAAGTKINCTGTISGTIEVYASNVKIKGESVSEQQIIVANGVKNVYLNGKLVGSGNESSQTEELYINKYYLREDCCMNDSRDQVYCYLSHELDENSVPTADAFTVIQNEKAIAVPNAIELRNVYDDKGTYICSYVKLSVTVQQPLCKDKHRIA